MRRIVIVGFCLGLWFSGPTANAQTADDYPQRTVTFVCPFPAGGVRLAQCGGDVPCECGDTVVADYTFTHHLACTLHGFEAALLKRACG